MTLAPLNIFPSVLSSNLIKYISPLFIPLIPSSTMHSILQLAQINIIKSTFIQQFLFGQFSLNF